MVGKDPTFGDSKISHPGDEAPDCNGLGNQLYFCRIKFKRNTYLTVSHTSHIMSDSEGELGIFEEPEGYYPPEKEPTFVTYTLQNGLQLKLRLVGHNPLWVGLSKFLLPTLPPRKRLFVHPLRRQCCFWHGHEI